MRTPIKVFAAYILVALVSTAGSGIAISPSINLAWADGPRNHLGGDDGPYLRLHATDPVHWRRWGDAALAEAERLNRPILLSIGYTACHWCHVMQKESFADPATAAVINENFVPVLVDREERPDIDSLYQTAAALLGLPTGWPLTMFLTPDGDPFFGGAYFPKEAMGGMQPFTTVLARVAKVYREDTVALRADAGQVRAALQQAYEPRPGEVTMAHVDAMARMLRAEADPLSGGFGTAPKFPHLASLESLWRAYLRNDDAADLEAVTLSLAGMVRGGMADHVGGGFYRYAVDPLWHIPHYEKMLDGNAGLIRLMTEVWRETRNGELERKIRQAVRFLLSELRLPGGAFASSLDADSINPAGEEEEGAYYTWTPERLNKALGREADLFTRFYAIGPT